LRRISGWSAMVSKSSEKERLERATSSGQRRRLAKSSSCNETAGGF
jgi:hypothetical protein